MTDPDPLSLSSCSPLLLFGMYEKLLAVLYLKKVKEIGDERKRSHSRIQTEFNEL